ncbi:MAG: hypothetical protein WBS14_09570 [Rhodomicrobium sp.]
MAGSNQSGCFTRPDFTVYSLSENAVQSVGNMYSISANTVVRFENEKHDANQATVLMIQRAFEVAGVWFKEGGVFPPEAKGDG